MIMKTKIITNSNANIFKKLLDKSIKIMENEYNLKVDIKYCYSETDNNTSYSALVIGRMVNNEHK